MKSLPSDLCKKVTELKNPSIPQTSPNQMRFEAGFSNSGITTGEKNFYLYFCILFYNFPRKSFFLIKINKIVRSHLSTPATGADDDSNAEGRGQKVYY